MRILSLILVAALAASGRYRMLIITKGDLRDQSRKFSLSQLDPHFTDIEAASHGGFFITEQRCALAPGVRAPAIKNASRLQEQGTGVQ